ncbi:MAG: LytTR family DNA-binding domain-containing protein [Chitinophagaceae bacterium]
MITCMIVDDEPLAREVIRHHLTGIKNWSIIRECTSAGEAFEALILQKVQVLFLDVQMPKILGTDFLRSLKDPPRIIFTTAHAGFAVEGFDLNAVDYLLKPIILERFLEAIKKAEAHLEPGTASSPMPGKHFLEEDFIFVKQDSRQIKVLFSDILFLEAKRDFTLIQLNDKKMLAGFHLKILEGILPPSKFMRIHRSYIVRLGAIEAMYGNTVEIKGFQIPISSSNKDELTRALGI